MSRLFALLLALTLTPTFSRAEEAAVAASEDALTLQEVHCQGNDSTACDFIASHLYLSPGDKIDESEIQNAKLRLGLLQNFSAVDVRLEKGAERGKAVVVIEVKEASPVTLQGSSGTFLVGNRAASTISGRASHNNLFGRGKILDFDVRSRLDAATNYSYRLQYIDPNFLGSKKYFVIGGAEYTLYDFDGSFAHYREEQVGVDLSFGRRTGQSSYVLIGHRYRPITNIQYNPKDDIYGGENYISYFRNETFVGFGFSNEDDPNFPTSGQSYSSSVRFYYDTVYAQGGKGAEKFQFNLDASYRTTWKSADNSIWSFRIGGIPNSAFRKPIDHSFDIAFSFARAFRSYEPLSVTKGRWYIETGIDSPNYSTYYGWAPSAGVKTGVRVDTKSFGLVDLFLVAKTDPLDGAR